MEVSNKKNKKFSVRLSRKDKGILKKLFQKGNQSVRVIKRVQILLNGHQRMSASVCAKLLSLTENTVRNIGYRYREKGLLSAIYEKPRSGQPKFLQPKQEQTLIAMACSSPPEGMARWTIDLIRQEGIKRGILPPIGQETIRVLLRNHDLKPWRKKMWCIPRLDQEYIQRMENVLDLYDLPYNPKEPVVCLDEKPIQLLDSSRIATSPIAPGKIQKMDYEYRRCGTANVFCGIEPKTGRHFNVPTNNRKAPEFAKMIARLSKAYPNADHIHLVMDNLNTHSEKSLINYYGKDKASLLWRKFKIHYTPKHASWLNQAEIAIGIYSKQCLGFLRIKSFEELKCRSKKWLQHANKNKSKINWRFTSKMAKIKFKY